MIYIYCLFKAVIIEDKYYCKIHRHQHGLIRVSKNTSPKEIYYASAELPPGVKHTPLSVYSETRTARTGLSNLETDKETCERRGESIMMLYLK